MTRTPRPTRVLAAVGSVLVLGLSACSAPLPQAQPDPVPAVAPAATTVSQTQTLLGDVGEVLTTADTALDAAQLTPRVEGPALAVRTAEYVRATATAGAKLPTALPTDEQALIVPQTDTWPRTQLVVTKQPDDLQAPRILVMQQTAPREPYRLWGWGRMGAGIQMPATAAAETGSPALAPDATGLLMTPTEALQQYADVLANGDASTFAASFEPDTFRTSIEAARAATASGVQAAGSATETYTPDAAPVVSLGTVDGGAIVVGQLTTVSTVTLTVAGGTIPIADPFYAALTGKQSAGSNFVRTFTDVLVMYVPPADSGAKVQLLAAEHAVTGATAE
ncbi:hypothetical protein [Cellulomonas fengjieae]|uniref:DUF8094 domain-containing protein n=1 Tax=Cellulomonas fengjieae TaxID=2819978 RepID=A0ABS3SKS3_9CELL|nr:hypothetical protein [Cellulomonas fengjieae]MBO3086348.1 hypothetical protein [Cellulomonas fengjieae]MBO3100345.1 hypothetical protein [Cellulomonas fengjieae]QVI66776.1 hypothetical protein KG102_04065 [Cellulomonas fengjieae]